MNHIVLFIQYVHLFVSLLKATPTSLGDEKTNEEKYTCKGCSLIIIIKQECKEQQDREK